MPSVCCCSVQVSYTTQRSTTITRSRWPVSCLSQVAPSAVYFSCRGFSDGNFPPSNNSRRRSPTSRHSGLSRPAVACLRDARSHQWRRQWVARGACGSPSVNPSTLCPGRQDASSCFYSVYMQHQLSAFTVPYFLPTEANFWSSLHQVARSRILKANFQKIFPAGGDNSEPLCGNA